MKQNSLTNQDLECIKHAIDQISKILSALDKHKYHLPPKRLGDGWRKIRETADALATALDKFTEPDPPPHSTEPLGQSSPEKPA